MDGKHILIIEDEALLGNLLKQRVERSGFKVTLFSNGADALKFLKTGSADLVLLDIIMPKMSGFDFLKEIHENPGYNNPPVVFISNLGQDEDIKKGKSLGAVGYFIKAKVSMDEIVKNIENFLSNN